MASNRNWMYNRLEDGLLKWEFLEGCEEFINFALGQPDFTDGEMIRCPCDHRKCRNRAFHDPDTVKLHLARYGFVAGYHRWYLHGEKEDGSIVSNQLRGNVSGCHDEAGPSTTYHTMVHDVAGPNFDWDRMEEPPNSESQRLFDMLAAANEELWPGCDKMSKLSAVARLLNIKAEHHLSERCYDDILEMWKDSLPDDNNLVENFYCTKKLMRGLGLPVEKIDCCTNNCMIYWGVDSDLRRARNGIQIQIQVFDKCSLDHTRYR